MNISDNASISPHSQLPQSTPIYDENDEQDIVPPSPEWHATSDDEPSTNDERVPEPTAKSTKQPAKHSRRNN